MPIHHDSKSLDLEATAALLVEVRASVARAAAAALDELAAAGPIESLSLRTWPPDFPGDLAGGVRVPWEARADPLMYRQIVAAAAEDRGWAVHRYDAKDVEGRAGRLLGDRAEEVLHGPRARLGAPWARDHRVALAATVLAATDLGGSPPR
jgi:glycine/D-amino acid oxidase-like deaminating enzyme